MPLWASQKEIHRKWTLYVWNHIITSTRLEILIVNTWKYSYCYTPMVLKGLTGLVNRVLRVRIINRQNEHSSERLYHFSHILDHARFLNGWRWEIIYYLTFARRLRELCANSLDCNENNYKYPFISKII